MTQRKEPSRAERRTVSICSERQTGREALPDDVPVIDIGAPRDASNSGPIIASSLSGVCGAKDPGSFSGRPRDQSRNARKIALRDSSTPGVTDTSPSLRMTRRRAVSTLTLLRVLGPKLSNRPLRPHPIFFPPPPGAGLGPAGGAGREPRIVRRIFFSRPLCVKS
jgi:hypothetical protein